MSQQVLFSLRIESVKYIRNENNLSVTNEFDESDVRQIVENRLQQEGLYPSFKSLEFKLKDGQLYVEGAASKIEDSNTGVDWAFIR